MKEKTQSIAVELSTGERVDEDIEEPTAVTIVEKQSPIALPQTDPTSLIALAVQQGASVETLERLFALHEKVQANTAKASFTKAMSNLQNELPIVKKLKANAGTTSNYAPLEDIVAQCKNVIKQNGFSYSWDTLTDEKTITVICKGTHIDGHTESSSMVSELAEGTRVNSAPQKAAITITYLKRYTLCNLFGIMVADEDQDARLEKANPKPKLPPNPKAKIMTLLKSLDLDTSDGEIIREEVKRLTGEELEEKNFDEIISKLTLLWQEQQENAN